MINNLRVYLFILIGAQLGWLIGFYVTGQRITVIHFAVACLVITLSSVLITFWGDSRAVSRKLRDILAFNGRSVAKAVELRMAAWWHCEACSCLNFKQLVHDEEAEASGESLAVMKLPDFVVCKECGRVFETIDGEFGSYDNADDTEDDQ